MPPKKHPETLLVSMFGERERAGNLSLPVETLGEE